MINGFLNINKEAGFTSHDVVAVLRGVTRQRKIGHTGTLDPMATGVLPVCLGKATKAVEMLSGHDKTYETALLLGKVTDTQDITGEVLFEASDKAADLSPEAILAAVNSFKGRQQQLPPMYSAKKVGGKKLYELAREGKTVERKPAEICIYDIEVLSVDLPHVQLRVTCSAGTYIRTICHDIGQKLGCGACMETLTRTWVGTWQMHDRKGFADGSGADGFKADETGMHTESAGIEDDVFSQKNAHTLAEIKELAKDGRLGEVLVPIDAAFQRMPAVTVPEIFSVKLRNGAPIPADEIIVLSDDSLLSETGEKHSGSDEAGSKTGLARMYEPDGTFFGIYEIRGRLMKPRQIFAELS